jgi:hypothetical protein
LLRYVLPNLFSRTGSLVIEIAGRLLGLLSRPRSDTLYHLARPTRCLPAKLGGLACEILSHRFALFECGLNSRSGPARGLSRRLAGFVDGITRNIPSLLLIHYLLQRACRGAIIKRLAREKAPNRTEFAAASVSR